MANSAFLSFPLVKCFAALSLVAILTACTPRASFQGAKPPGHEIGSKIYRLPTQEEISFQELLEELEPVRYILLGEQHQVPEHFEYRGQLLYLLAKRADSVGTVFEHFTDQHQPVLNQVSLLSPEMLEKLLEWKGLGWIEWEQFWKLLGEAKMFGKVRAGRSNRCVLERLVKEVESGAGEDSLVARYGLNRPLPKELAKQLKAELRSAHHFLDSQDSEKLELQIERMLRVQRIWDAQMAEALKKTDAAQVFLFAGNEHVRKDRGVPFYLRRGQSESSGAFRTVAFVRLEEGDELLEWLSKNSDSFDYVYFTP